MQKKPLHAKINEVAFYHILLPDFEALDHSKSPSTIRVSHPPSWVTSRTARVMVVLHLRTPLSPTRCYWTCCGWRISVSGSRGVHRIFQHPQIRAHHLTGRRYAKAGFDRCANDGQCGRPAPAQPPRNVGLVERRQHHIAEWARIVSKTRGTGSPCWKAHIPPRNTSA